MKNLERTHRSLSIISTVERRMGVRPFGVSVYRSGTDVRGCKYEEDQNLEVKQITNHHNSDTVHFLKYPRAKGLVSEGGTLIVNDHKG